MRAHQHISHRLPPKPVPAERAGRGNFQPGQRAPLRLWQLGCASRHELRKSLQNFTIQIFDANAVEAQSCQRALQLVSADKTGGRDAAEACHESLLEPLAQARARRLQHGGEGKPALGP